MNLTLITSIIDTPNKPLSYTPTRSVYTKQERFDQTKYTIETIRLKIPDNKIIMVECSQLTQEEREYFINNTDYFINLYDKNDDRIIERIHSISKSLGESTMTKYALEYIIENNIDFKNLFKISGRYWLNDKFIYDVFNNNYPVINFINDDTNNALTSLYKIPKNMIYDFYLFIKQSDYLFYNCIGYENFFALFLKNYTDIKINKVMGVSGYISIAVNAIGDYMNN